MQTEVEKGERWCKNCIFFADVLCGVPLIRLIIVLSVVD